MFSITYTPKIYNSIKHKQEKRKRNKTIFDKTKLNLTSLLTGNITLKYFSDV